MLVKGGTVVQGRLIPQNLGEIVPVHSAIQGHQVTVPNLLVKHHATSIHSAD